MSASGSPRVETLKPDGAVALREVEAALLALRSSVPCRRALDAGLEELPDQPITRACMSNLIVYCDDATEADRLHDELDALGRVHPARMIVLVADPTRPIERPMAMVRAGLSDHAHRRQVSSEQIRIDVPARDPVRMASAARPLLIGDLPSALWWNSKVPPALARETLAELLTMTSSLVYDSRGWRDPARGLVAMANGLVDRERRLLVADLAWMRQRGWRRIFAEILSPHLLPGALTGIESVRLEHGPHALPLVALFAGWLAGALGWSVENAATTSGSSLDVRFRSPSGIVKLQIVRRTSGTDDLQLAQLVTRTAGEPLGIQFEALSDERIAVRVGDGALAENFVHVPREPRIASLAWQLANRSGDPAFRSALVQARNLARELTQ